MRLSNELLIRNHAEDVRNARSQVSSCGANDHDYYRILAARRRCSQSLSGAVDGY
jgi:hypothetical protein